MVSPGRGKLLLKVVRSVFALPTTAMRGDLAMHSPERRSRGKIYQSENTSKPHGVAMKSKGKSALVFSDTTSIVPSRTGVPDRWRVDGRFRWMLGSQIR